MTQDAVITELVDCGLLVSTYTVEQDDGSFISYDLPAGRSTNNVEFDACQRSEIRLSYSSPVVTKYDCATTDMLDRSRYKCNQATHGTDPWSPEGLTETQGGGGLYVYYCCSTDDCTAGVPSGSDNVGSGNDNSGENVAIAPSGPGFQYSQDPSWQDGTGRNCVCSRQWDDDANAFDDCVPTVWANPLLQSDSLGACNAFSDQDTATWRIKLEGVGTQPGFAFGVDVAIRNSWQGWCVNCEAGASQVYFYSDGRCSNSALTTSFELELDQCAVDGGRGIGNGVYYTATCGASDIPANACPGTVAVEPLAFSIGVYSRNDCRGAAVGGFEWRVTAASIEAAPTGVLGGETWGAGGACIPYSSLQTTGLDTGGFLLSELLQLRSIAGLSAASPLARAYPRTPIPDTDSVAFRVCASHSSGLTLAWYSDLGCADPMVLSAPQIGDQATSGSDLLSTNGTTGMEYPLSCVSAGDLPFRSSRAQPLLADGRSIDRRWVYVELNTSIVPVLSSCPALPPAPPPDVDCAGDWKPCTAACEQQRTWLGTRQPLGLGRACPYSQRCSAGDGECVGSTTDSESGMTLIIMAVVAAILLALACGFGVLYVVRTKRSGAVNPRASEKTNDKTASQSSSNDSTDSGDGTVRHKQQLKYLKSGKQSKEEEDAGNDAGNVEKAAMMKVNREVTESTDHDNVSVYSGTSDDENENEKLQHKSDDSISKVESKASQLAVMMTAKHEFGKHGKKHSPITVSSSSESDSEHESAMSSRKAGTLLAATGASIIMRGGRAGRAGRGGRGGRGSRAGRARGQVRGVARAAFSFGRGRGSTQSTRQRADSEHSEDSDVSEIEDESLAHEEAERLRQKLAAADKHKARERARAKAIAKARSRGARGTYMSDAAVATLPRPVPELEPQQLPGQLPGSTQQVGPAPVPSWMDDAPGGKNAQAKAVAAAARVPPKLRIPASLSSMDLREALRQQQDLLSNPSGQQAQADGAMDEARVKAKAKARARAVAAARRRQGLDDHGYQNVVVERARKSAAAANARNHSLKEASFATAVSDELVTPAQKALRGLPADDLKSLRAMLHELEEQ